MDEQTPDGFFKSGISEESADSHIPGGIIELDPEIAARHGAFAETGLDEATSREANLDLDLH